MADTAVRPAGAGHTPAPERGRLFRFLFVHEIDEYPPGGRRTALLGLAILATIVLYYTYYTQTGVTPTSSRPSTCPSASTSAS